MLIKKVKYNSHPVLGNLELDFTNPDTGKPYNTILFAGENGTGKTTILETISTFLNKGTFEYFESIDYIIEGEELTAIPTDSTVKDFYKMVDSGGVVTPMNTNKNNHNSQVDDNPLNIRYNGCVLSKARADYKTEAINSTTTKEIDIDKYDLDTEDDFTSLKQLIIDIEDQDTGDYAIINRELGEAGSAPKSWEDFYVASKIYRFKNAFDGFFEKLRYDKVSNAGVQKNIFFLKNNKSISIDNLSTGEKQIVFRGAYLLRNNKNLTGAAIMIDEPELSMHPKWEQKILNYYTNLFTQNNKQTAQIFIATHSEHILKEALKDKDNNLVIVLKEDNGIIEERKIDAPNVLPTITSAETNYLAFDIASNDYHIELYGYLQTKESKNSVKSCDTFIKDNPLYNSGRHSKASSFGSTTYETLPTYIRNAIDHPSTTGEFTDEELRTSIEFLVELCG